MQGTYCENMYTPMDAVPSAENVLGSKKTCEGRGKGRAVERAEKTERVESVERAERAERAEGRWH